MKMLICSISDRQMETYGRPFFAAAKGQAIRSFIDEINRNSPDNLMYNHPEDFTLWHVGNFNDQTGEIESVPLTKESVLFHGQVASERRQNAE